ncbi:MAG: hypothetical protein AB1899_18025 [Pseudomonadota bacterium]
MLIALIAATLLAFLAGQTLPRVFAAAPAFWAHVPLALGVMTLITAAMQHFAPVLTRGRSPGPWIARLPGLMFLAGTLAVAVFAGGPGYAWLSVAAGLALAVGLAMLAWMVNLGRRTLGTPHPGLHWYVAAMGCLALGLFAALLLPFFPQWHGPLRAFHLHINLYGFVGLTAVGTLQVLMPTAAGQADPDAASRLRQDLKWALAGSLLLAGGQASGLPLLAWLGALGWGWTLLRLLTAWWRRHRKRILAWHGAEPLLAVATLGFAAALTAHLGGWVEGGPLALFLPGFLMPLVSGAAGQLAPVWVGTGRPALRHAQDRARLTRWNGLRALLFLAAILLPLLGYRCAGMPALTALAWFGIVFGFWLYRDTD